ncbi:unnamed protein product [Periconia digitata]|uniref:Uncharacterized protein n=1 Tax=Periconia digitata TaxID=1303443 RepID=A0A9W4U782_9PLEO|nr:unnamed protein product [Periconia digitata]
MVATWTEPRRPTSGNPFTRMVSPVVIVDRCRLLCLLKGIPSVNLLSHRRRSAKSSR